MLEKSNLEILNADLLCEIFSYLKLEKTVSMRLVSQFFSKGQDFNVVFEKRVEQHFPHIYKTLDRRAKVNWHEKFREIYGDEYKNLPVASKKLFTMVKENDLEILNAIQILDDFGIYDNNGQELSYWIIKKKNQAICNHAYSVFEDTDLMTAINFHQPVEIISPLIPNYGDINKMSGDWNPLLAAAYSGNFAALCLLLDLRANIHVRGLYNGTPLHCAAQEGQLNIVCELLRRGAHIDATNDECLTPLHLAAQFGHCSVVEELLKQGANAKLTISAPIDVGATALTCAIRSGHTDVVRLLISQTDIDIKKSKIYGSLNSVHLAKLFGFTAIVRVLSEKLLDDYLEKINAKSDNDYSNSFYNFTAKYHDFGLFGYTAKQNKEAAKALKDVVENRADKASLDAYKGPLNNDELGEIYEGLTIS